MNQILDNLWIGDSDSARNLDALKREGITAVLNCAFDLDVVHPYRENSLRFEEIEYYKCGVPDSSEASAHMLAAAVLILNDLLKRGHRVLVHCHAGRSRSVTVTAAYLAKWKATSIELQIKRIEDIRWTMPAEGIVPIAEQALRVLSYVTF
jgi:protein-tyrosine phosphatase